MNRGTDVRTRLRHRQRNPLRRRSDLAEAWMTLVMWAVVVVGGPIAGVATAYAAQGTFDQERADRHPVRAVVLTHAPRGPAADESGSHGIPATVRWATPDGTQRTGRTRVSPDPDTGLRRGSPVTVWLDTRGALTAPPTGRTEAAIEAAVFGSGAALGLTGAAFGAASLGRWTLDRRRLAQWQREWERVGPLWSRQAH
ncbi:hypothetical protein ACFY93_28820 [Streptomyces sp. NPDC008313]|uniref:Rv1733c family protein n=1 Tax=Streptomyces sp. NPDC008313 TaxID=3364826 RepID=UPI0036E4FB13